MKENGPQFICLRVIPKHPLTADENDIILTLDLSREIAEQFANWLRHVLDTCGDEQMLRHLFTVERILDVLPPNVANHQPRDGQD